MSISDLVIQPDGIGIALFRVAYKRRKPSVLEPSEPRLKWLPKYRFRVRIPDAVLAADEPSDALESSLSAAGFELAFWTRTSAFYARGKSWGDFSIKYMRIFISFPLPLERDSEMTVEVADVCLFDTGDLWKLSCEVKELIESESRSP